MLLVFDIIDINLVHITLKNYVSGDWQVIIRNEKLVKRKLGLRDSRINLHRFILLDLQLQYLKHVILRNIKLNGQIKSFA